MNAAEERNKISQAMSALKEELDATDINTLADFDAIHKMLEKIDAVDVQIKQFISRFGVNDWNSWGPATWNYIERNETALKRKLHSLERADLQKSNRFNKRMAYLSALFAAISAIAAIFSAYSSSTPGNSYSEHYKTISGSATAEMGADGAIAIASRKPTKAELNSLENLRTNLNEIDRKYPGPQMPANAKKMKVISVDNSGNIALENGQRIQMEGVKCSSQGISYLQKSLIGDSNSIVYISSANNQNPARVYIWQFFESGYSQLNEAVLTSGWCVAERSSSNSYNDRYEALSRIAPNR